MTQRQEEWLLSSWRSRVICCCRWRWRRRWSSCKWIRREPGWASDTWTGAGRCFRGREGRCEPLRPPLRAPSQGWLKLVWSIWPIRPRRAAVPSGRFYRRNQSQTADIDKQTDNKQTDIDRQINDNMQQTQLVLFNEQTYTLYSTNCVTPTLSMERSTWPSTRRSAAYIHVHVIMTCIFQKCMESPS